MLKSTTLLAASNCMYFQNYSDTLDPMLYKDAPPELVTLIQDKIGLSYFLPEDVRVVDALGFSHYPEEIGYWRTRSKTVYSYSNGKKEAFCTKYILFDGLWYYNLDSDSETDKNIVEWMHVGKVMDQKYHSSDILAAINGKFPGLKQDGIYLAGKFKLGDKFFDLHATTFGTADGYWYAQANMSGCRDMVDRELDRTIIQYNFTNRTEGVRWFINCKKQYEELRAKSKAIDID